MNRLCLPRRKLQERGLDLIECLNFIFQLSFSTLGKVRERNRDPQDGYPVLNVYIQHVLVYILGYQGTLLKLWDM